MKQLARIALSAIALAAATAASAAPFDSADQARRAQNREEVLAKHGIAPASYRSSDYRPIEEPSSRPTLRERTHRAAQATRNFGHRTADKMRDIGDRTNAKFDKKGSPSKDPYNHGPQ